MQLKNVVKMKNMSENKNKTVLKPHHTKILLKKQIFKKELTFLRFQESVGYVFMDEYGNVEIITDLNDPFIEFC